jgi:hypothetical protein
MFYALGIKSRVARGSGADPDDGEGDGAAAEEPGFVI